MVADPLAEGGWTHVARGQQAEMDAVHMQASVVAVFVPEMDRET